MPHLNPFPTQADDVPGAQPTATAILKPRDTDPLNPVYKLAYKEPDPVFVPKFIRDQISVEDIEVRPLRRFFTAAPREKANYSSVLCADLPRWELDG